MLRFIWILVALSCCGCTTLYQKRGAEPPVPWSKAGTLQSFESNANRLGSDKLRLDAESRSIERFWVDEVAPGQVRTLDAQRFTIGVVEISDEGAFNPSQYDQVLQALRCEVALGSPSGEGGGRMADRAFNDQCRALDASYDKQLPTKGTLVVVFVHGWHHSCRTCDRDVTCFRTVLDNLSREPAMQGKRVFGLYVGWRGQYFVNQKADYLSIWGRKRVAERIGRSAGKELLSELHSLWSGNENMTMVTVGHSLGGALLLQAARGHLTGNAADILKGEEASYRVARAKSLHSGSYGTKPLRSRFGDLVVLLNPAIEAGEWDAFDRDLYDRKLESTLSIDPDVRRNQLIENRMPTDKFDVYDVNQLPVMISLSSSADVAVGFYFPFSRVLGAINPKRWLNIHHGRQYQAVGRYEPYITHRLAVDLPERPGDLDYKMTSCTCPYASQFRLLRAQAAIAPLAKTQTESADLAEAESVRASSIDSEDPRDMSVPQQSVQKAAPKSDLARELKWSLQPVPERDCGLDYALGKSIRECPRGWDRSSPYWVLRTDSRAIGGHNDVFNPVVVGLLSDYLARFWDYREKRPLLRKTDY